MSRVISLGCRLNLAESEAIRVMVADRLDLMVINSCAVTAEAAKQSRQAARKAKRDNPLARVFITGCAVELDRDRLAPLGELVSNSAKLLPASYGVSGAPAPAVASEHARAFVPVQDGCDHACTFCIIPQGRGPSRSVPAAQLVEQIASLVERGYREVVLTGVDLTSYRPSLGALVETILRDVPALPRLRLSSLDPAEIDPVLFELIASEPRVMPHLHLSLQAGDDLVLKRMKRRHSRAQAIALVERVRARRDVAIGADLIAGFPTEDAAMAANSLALVEQCDIRFGHVFPYSPRPGTPAARMPQVDPLQARARAAALREASGARRTRWLESLRGTVQKVLIEKDGVSGHAESFAKVRLVVEEEGQCFDRLSTNGGLAGSIVDVRVTGRDGDVLIGARA